MVFKFIKLEQAVNQNSNPNYFGYYVTNETDKTKYLYLDSTDLNGKYLLKRNARSFRKQMNTLEFLITKEKLEKETI